MTTETVRITHPTNRPNFTETEYPNGITVWYSYSTPVAFKFAGWPLTLRQNDWSTTTARHLYKARERSGTRRTDWIIGPLSGRWFNAALKTALAGGSIADWLESMTTN